MISVNQEIGTSVPEKVEKWKKHDVSYEGETFDGGGGEREWEKYLKGG